MFRVTPEDRPGDPRQRASARRGKRDKGKAQGRSRRPRIRLRPLLSWTLVATIWVAIAGLGVIGWFAYDLPSVDRFAELTRRPSVTLVSAEGARITAVGDLYGETVRVSELPPHVSQAVLAVEDRRFYQHPGIDAFGLLRALLVNLHAGRIVQGGSTITQQLAKIMFLEPERTVKRKVQEALLAFWLERRFSKEQILTLYLNRVYLGAGTYGLDAAAQRYFGVGARELTLHQAAMLAGLLKAPSRYNPANDPGLADGRAGLVLDAMVEAGFITAEAAAQAKQDKGGPSRVADQGGRYFADWVLGQLSGFVGPVDRDLVVVTTLDPRLQRIAEEEVRAMIAGDGAVAGMGQAAFIALAPDGAVRALVGGRDYRESQFNRATQALRQQGSAFKAFVYLAALQQGFSPDDRMIDRPVRLANWEPKNFDNKYYGEVTLREAFARSLNSVAVQLIQKVGPAAVAQTAHRLGITSDLAADAGLALGTSETTLLELTSAYSTFANQGRGVWPYAILEVREPNGRILYQRSGGGPGRLVAPHQVNAMLDLLRAGVAWGTGKAADPGRPAGGKTGTSQDNRDAWFIGLTAELTAGVWMGNDDGTRMRDVTGGTLPVTSRMWATMYGTVASPTESVAMMM
ncbi:MAG: transglycosylase domain-containing protein, partial [Kiloniellales bacterium]